VKLQSLLFVSLVACAASSVNAAQPTRAEVNALLEQATNQISKKLPRNIDKETILFAIEAGDLRLKYYMQVPNISAERLKPLMDTLRVNAKNLICTTPNTRAMVGYGVIAEFVYYDHASAFIGGYSVSVKDCDGATAANQL